MSCVIYKYIYFFSGSKRSSEKFLHILPDPSIQLPRHFPSKHKEEPEIKNLPFLSPKRKRSRLKAGAKLFNDGIVNEEATITSRYKDAKASREAFVEYDRCHMLYKHSSLPQHFRKCQGNSWKTDKTVCYPEEASALLQEHVLKRMHNDDIFNVIKTDPLILKYESRILDMNRNEQDIYYHASTKMRGSTSLAWNPFRGFKNFLFTRLSPANEIFYDSELC